MALKRRNTTCDIYRSGSAPPAAPDVAAVACLLRPAYAEGREGGEGAAVVGWTHVMLVEVSVDVRDGFNGGSPLAAAYDSLYVPDQNGTVFRVLFVERVARGTSFDHKRVFLRRDGVTWPSNDL